PGDNFIGILAFAPVGIAWAGAARKDGQHHYFGVGEILPELEHVGAYAPGNLSSRCTARVVRAEHEHDGLGFVALALAILQTP
ncbi:hypothetical protein Q8G81_34930, partial [Klebsiella pneumoniae]